MSYSEYCVLTSLHSRKRGAQFTQGGSHTHGLGIRMVEAERLWHEARGTEVQLPILFSNAEAEMMELVCWGVLDDITVSLGRWTNLAYMLVDQLSPPRPISSLRLKSKRRPSPMTSNVPTRGCLRPAFIT
jgi:hypothetical protein